MSVHDIRITVDENRKMIEDLRGQFEEAGLTNNVVTKEMLDTESDENLFIYADGLSVKNGSIVSPVSLNLIVEKDEPEENARNGDNLELSLCADDIIFTVENKKVGHIDKNSLYIDKIICDNIETSTSEKYAIVDVDEDKIDLSGYVQTEQIPGYLEPYTLKDELKNYVSTQQLTSLEYVPKKEMKEYINENALQYSAATEKITNIALKFDNFIRSEKDSVSVLIQSQPLEKFELKGNSITALHDDQKVPLIIEEGLKCDNITNMRDFPYALKADIPTEDDITAIAFKEFKENKVFYEREEDLLGNVNLNFVDNIKMFTNNFDLFLQTDPEKKLRLSNNTLGFVNGSGQPITLEINSPLLVDEIENHKNEKFITDKTLKTEIDKCAKKEDVGESVRIDYDNTTSTASINIKDLANIDVTTNAVEFVHPYYKARRFVFGIDTAEFYLIEKDESNFQYVPIEIHSAIRVPDITRYNPDTGVEESVLWSNNIENFIQNVPRTTGGDNPIEYGECALQLEPYYSFNIYDRDKMPHYMEMNVEDCAYQFDQYGRIMFRDAITLSEGSYLYSIYAPTDEERDYVLYEQTEVKTGETVEHTYKTNLHSENKEIRFEWIDEYQEEGVEKNNKSYFTFEKDGSLSWCDDIEQREFITDQWLDDHHVRIIYNKGEQKTDTILFNRDGDNKVINLHYLSTVDENNDKCLWFSTIDEGSFRILSETKDELDELKKQYLYNFNKKGILTYSTFNDKGELENSARFVTDNDIITNCMIRKRFTDPDTQKEYTSCLIDLFTFKVEGKEEYDEFPARINCDGYSLDIDLPFVSYRFDMDGNIKAISDNKDLHTFATQEWVQKNFAPIVTGGGGDASGGDEKYVLKTDFEAYKKNDDDAETEKYVTKDEMNNYATKDEIPTVPDMTNYATKDQIPDVSNLATKDEIPTVPDMTNYATKDQIPDVSNLATKDEIPTVPDMTNYATKSDLDNYVLKSESGTSDILEQYDNIYYYDDSPDKMSVIKLSFIHENLVLSFDLWNVDFMEGKVNFIDKNGKPHYIKYNCLNGMATLDDDPTTYNSFENKLFRIILPDDPPPSEENAFFITFKEMSMELLNTFSNVRIVSSRHRKTMLEEIYRALYNAAKTT
ncbi:hypothetical protein TRFO_25485 [Tritrichomonas foetus]|uniref:Uncharacterized protein n=1 Tax=Tritrichomonas foetus TaxID=1144522 RepID=A0A1J4KAI0_9EUKA|nr:hypothetical protein TRFO_25485 [Tritrichomonas foetus]|eukprot:OHT06461.1 hypothetical protein TRFO_25485 [Tritrichomonas foetus]